MPISGLRVAGVRFLPGCSAGLAERTAYAEIDYDGDGILDSDALARIRTGVSTLWPGEPLYRVRESDWPAVFLVDSPPGDSSRLGEWLVALTVAIQRWARLPVWRGRVAGCEPNRLRLALPWSQEAILRGALSFAVQLVEQWARPNADPGAVRDIVSYLQRSIPPAQPYGLMPDSLRYVQAAVERHVPFEVHPNCIQIGWGAESDRIDGTRTASTGFIAATTAQNAAAAGRLLADAGLPVGEWRGKGDGYRLLVVRGRLLAAARRAPLEDVTASVHPDNRILAERAARVIGLDVVGIDVSSTDIARSWQEVGGAICAVDDQPDSELHRLADPARDISGEVFDALFGGRSFRIPTAAITGTNGKTTTCAMLHHIWLTAGVNAGLATTMGLQVGRDVVSTRNLSGQPGAQILLNDPAVEAAVLEMPRKGLIYLGHPCDRYDVAALLNLTDDHLGVDGVETLEELAELKAEVLALAGSAIIVNAEDPLCMAMRSRAGTRRHILVAHQADSVAAHRSSGGEAVFAAQRDGRSWMILAAGDSETALMPFDDIPATMGGLLRVNESNAMFAAAMAWAHGIDLSAIREALAGFTNQGEQNRGRYTFVEGLPFTVLLDFAHNPDGVYELCRVVSQLPVEGRRLACSLNLGSRHANHVGAVSAVLTQTFDEIVFGCDYGEISGSPDYGGDDPVGSMLAQARAVLLAGGFPAESLITEADQQTAVRMTLTRAQPGDLVVVLAEPHDLLPVIDTMLERTV